MKRRKLQRGKLSDDVIIYHILPYICDYKTFLIICESIKIHESPLYENLRSYAVFDLSSSHEGYHYEIPYVVHARIERFNEDDTSVLRCCKLMRRIRGAFPNLRTLEIYVRYDMNHIVTRMLNNLIKDYPINPQMKPITGVDISILYETDQIYFGTHDVINKVREFGNKVTFTKR